MSEQPSDVDAFLDGLDHPRRSDIDDLRHLIADARPDLSEGVKWNAPSFKHAGADRITLRLQPKDRLEVIFHRGAKRRADAFAFDDPSGLIQWADSDRGVVTVPDARFLVDHRDALRRLVDAWITAATDTATGG